MTITIILLANIIAFLIYRLYKSKATLDDWKVLSNRSEMLKLAYADFEQGKIDKDFYRLLGFLFHPDFKNIWGYVPPERQKYTRQMYIIDSNFWKTYKITPDFVIPAEIVFELYKNYISQHLNISTK